MAVNPPVVLPPSPATEPVTSNLGELWAPLLPLDELQAKSPIERHLTLGRDVLPVLALLTSQAAGGPHMVKSDDAGRVLMSTVFSTFSKATVPTAAGSGTVAVPDATLFPPGSYLFHVDGTNLIWRRRVLKIVDSTHIATATGGSEAVAVGDALIAVPSVLAEQPLGPVAELTGGHTQVVAAAAERYNLSQPPTNATYLYDVQVSANQPGAVGADFEFRLRGVNSGLDFRVAKFNMLATSQMVTTVPFNPPLDLGEIFGPGDTWDFVQACSQAGGVGTMCAHFRQNV